jgi:hypothetical protein
MGTKSRETIYGGSVRAAAEQAAEARRTADRLAREAWNKRMLGFQGPAQQSPTLGDAINAGYGYLEVKCLGCNTHPTAALDIVRRPQRRSMNWSATCAAASAPMSGTMPTTGVIRWRSARLRSRLAIRRQRRGRASDEHHARHPDGRHDRTNLHVEPRGRRATRLLGLRGSWAIHRNHYPASPETPA